MIPKVIHYVWLGGKELSDDAKKNIETWKKYNPDYEIKEWNESNFDISAINYTKEAYAAKKWGFVADYIRLWALYNYGGIYMDTDVECVKSFDEILDNNAVLCFEGKYYVSSAILLSEKGNKLFYSFLKAYENRHFIIGQENGEYVLDLFSQPAIITCDLMKFYKKHFIKNGYYKFADVTLLPQDYLSPNIWIDLNDHYKCVTPNTITIHHFNGSWKNKEERILTKWQKLIIHIRFAIAFKFTKLLGNVNFLKLEQSTYVLQDKFHKKNKQKQLRKNKGN